MVLRAFDIPEGTLQAMTELAEITDANSESPLTGLIVDALRVYEWILGQQARGKVIAALTPVAVETVDPERERLVLLIAPERREQARKYFAKA